MCAKGAHIRSGNPSMLLVMQDPDFVQGMWRTLDLQYSYNLMVDVSTLLTLRF